MTLMLIPAVRLVQNERELFLCALGAEVLADPRRVVADTYSSANPEGYQREKQVSRIRAFASYLLGKGDYKDAEALFPNGLVLNARKKLAFTPDAGSGFGMLNLRDHKLYEVDGQHRIGGFQLAYGMEPDKLADFTFPCVITNGLERTNEALTFYLNQHDASTGSD
jgi:DGQHR domain-containing protein